MTTLQVFLSIFSGTIVGFVLGLLGGGGSILAVPLLLYVVGMKDPHVVIGTTALAVAINAYVNLIPHSRAGNVQWKEAIVFAIPGALSAYTGSMIGKLVPGKQLLFLFAILMIVMAVKMVSPKKEESSQADNLKNQIKMPQLIIMAILVGLLSGFFGIGGGFLIVPGLIFAARMPMIAAIGTSLVSVGTFGLTTAVSYSFSGLINWWVMLAFVGGGVGGGMVGARLAARLSKQRRTLQYIFSGVVMFVAIYMLIINAEALDL
ncbi:sulfite exporter TauE/SafE family protein [Bacillus sp. X1(2014)]|uniref:sulfite exporter TauE/SafE family protein n=1 Tax=Bacillus sp. X1(2014) TaxID=1565991 RepID=UPI0011A17038|nr:sulfite exporter TauE/SafE family protein [Bacillus sp. X1(2014)]